MQSKKFQKRVRTSAPALYKTRCQGPNHGSEVIYSGASLEDAIAAAEVYAAHTGERAWVECLEDGATGHAVPRRHGLAAGGGR